jgi:putative tryptophan/tyrosine transport system substrate-binding protein
MRSTVAALIVTIAVGILAAPPESEAQQARKVYRVGILQGTTPVSTWRAQPFNQVFLDELRRLGYAEGQNLAIDYRSAEGEWRRLPHLAAELVSLKADTIMVGVCGAPLDAARRATNTIPTVVAACNDDMVATGIVASLSRPGGNITGLSKVTRELAAKRLELLTEALPKVSRVAVLWIPAIRTSQRIGESYGLPPACWA